MDAINPDSTPATPKTMDTGALKKFAQEARRTLRGQVQAKLALVLADGSAARRENPKAVKALEDEIAAATRDEVIERAAYTWFNRFTALRFMDANGYTNPRVVTPADGQMRPEILSEAVAGVIGDEVPAATATHIRALLDGGAPSRDPQGEAYRLLVVAACNGWHAAMPFMFEPIADWTELLMPEDLLSPGSILGKLRAAMTDGACQDVEIIGWLYQFYISEKKDEVFAGLKRNVKITPENIPAATQLFTPHWIVRYLVENSLGRLWLLNRPASKLAAQMPYYIAPVEPETDFLRIGKPEDIKVCDPACGSGHMLTYAFDLLYAIYEEEGYDPAEIPGLILTHNLYGIEIDGRAGALAAFALAMKAAARRRRFLRRPVQPNVCVLENVTFAKGELDEYVKEAGRDLFTADLRETLTQFAEAKNFGSLIVPKLRDVAETRRVIAAKDFEGNLFLRDVHARVQTVLRMAEFLSAKYHVVVANPPYMGRANVNGRLNGVLEKEYPIGRHDLFASFILRGTQLNERRGFTAMVTPQNWMFLSSFEALRQNILESGKFSSLVQIGYNSFPELNSKVVQAVAFVLFNDSDKSSGQFINLNDAPENSDKNGVFFRKMSMNDIHIVASSTFERMPGSPIIYWVSSTILDVFAKNKKMAEIVDARNGMTTGDNDKFLRLWTEVSIENTTIKQKKLCRWFPYNKGGPFRKWAGNQEYVVDWLNGGEAINNIKPKSTPRNTQFFFKESVSWSDINMKTPSFRYYSNIFCFDAAVNSAFPKSKVECLYLLLALNNSFVFKMAPILNPTIHFKIGDFGALPAVLRSDKDAESDADKLLEIAKLDWDSYETSWDFARFPLLSPEHRQTELSDTYARLRAHWRSLTAEMQRLEEKNNRILIDACGLQKEMTPEVPSNEITLTCNPAYRYGGTANEAALEVLLRADTVREFVSYAVGCMFGRYSLDEPGLILANAGDGLDAYLAKVPKPTFAPVADNVIPVLDGDWFAGDIAARFRTFLRVTFGDAHFQDNLAFVQDALGKDIGKYFVRDFFNDHVKRYKKRPIYWLFSSPKGTFNALIYMHRYRPDTVSTVLNDYLRPFRGKLEAHRRAQETQSISAEATAGQKTKALKAIEAVRQQIEELDAWERDVLYPLATQRIEIDLDDGVKANYPRFGAALKPIKGLNDAED